MSTASLRRHVRLASGIRGALFSLRWSTQDAMLNGSLQELREADLT